MMRFCTPGMGVNLWDESLLYVNPVNGLYSDTDTGRRQGRNSEGRSKEAGAQSHELTNRNSTKGRVSG